MKFINLIFNIVKITKELKKGLTLIWVKDRFCLVPPEQALIYNIQKDKIDFTDSKDFENWYSKVKIEASEQDVELDLLVYYEYSGGDKMPLIKY